MTTMCHNFAMCHKQKVQKKNQHKNKNGKTCNR